MKKRNFRFPVWLTAFGLLVSCDQGFDEMNINPIALTSVDPAFQFNTAVVNSAFGYNNLQYETIIVKQMINPFSGVGAAGQYNQDNRSVTAANWERGYRNVVRELVDILVQSKDVPARSNLYHMTRIWRAFSFMLLTDTYGDIPYKDAGKSYLEGIVAPAYDSQQDIYTDIISELESATAALDASKPRVTSDVLYSGDIPRWKRFGNSLLLRAGMRLSKVNPTRAAEVVAKAVAGGVMQSNDDNAVMRHNANFQNPVGTQLNGGQSDFFYLAEDFVTYLKANNDPRLAAIAVRYVGARSTTDQREALANRTPAIQIGMPLGYDNTTVSAAVTRDKLASLYDYSQLDRTRMGGAQAPTFFLTYAQTQLLMAEAVVRRWIPGDAATFYANGIRAHMRQLAAYGTSTAIAEPAITAYVDANPMKAGSELEQINTQYWVASFLNGPEAWANFRRTDFPKLTPNPFPGSDLKTEPFIRRLTYTDAELNVNKVNVQKAIERQGPNLLDTRVWWDKK
ncbi:SusD/RagB family nutrient-binding outer membrane lipoprotein [Tellurirhabdus rosea]|uniref:SusD/RagB family nutrient-binding outer membrane lipoprotein n=1 Tax=Tellurirhabdus rosea TaxID=2674997 RepID=UPI002257E68D|nr:SusD/RagB family nutrient-binding outer membrane lipoprotein [Tellurirhabdus rosea]